MPFEIPDWRPEKWRDVPENPLIEPSDGSEPGSVIGDPQVIPPGKFDEYWHLFAHSGMRIYRFKSLDGIHWKSGGTLPFPGALVYLFKEDDTWYIFYTVYEEPPNTKICMRESVDLESWSEETVILKPELPWELEGPCKQVRNPCLVKVGDRYRLYYSGGTIWFDDCGYEEPKYVGFAEAEDIHGPYKRCENPILRPDPNVPYRNFGAGALKVYRWRGEYLGFNNGIYKDSDGRSRSAICLLASSDGVAWVDAPFNPVIAPTGGWKRAMVYQLDVVFDVDGETRIYYNARDGWRGGVERIGCSILVER